MKQEVKVLLLGQSESGKSTTLKRESDLYFRIGVVFAFSSSTSVTTVPHAKALRSP